MDIHYARLEKTHKSPFAYAFGKDNGDWSFTPWTPTAAQQSS
jgi:hypothetical protein